MPMIGASEEKIQRDRERERLMNFIKENPYPDKSTTTL
jgi:hypothetical protein